MLEESKVLHFIQRWAQTKTLLPQVSELDGYSSENTSRAQTPLNTPDGAGCCKPTQELDTETPKRAVYRRLKIISDNSMDSALSDASKASDVELEAKEGKEEEDEEEDDEADSSQADLAESQPCESQSSDSKESQDNSIQPPDNTGESQAEPQTEPRAEGDSQAACVETSTESEDIGVKDTGEFRIGSGEELAPCGEARDNDKSRAESGVPQEGEEKEEQTSVQPGKTGEGDRHTESEAPQTPSLCLHAELKEQPQDEDPEVGPKLEESMAVETPSQDEEEGVSDVESERSQEPTHKITDISEMASKLLDNEVYRIPKKSQVEKEPQERGRDSQSLRDHHLTPRTPSGSLERDRDRERDRESERTPHSKDRKRRRSSLSPPHSIYERSNRRGDDRYDVQSSSSKKGRTKERNKLSTEERRKLFEQEVAQREAHKQQQLQHTVGVGSPMPYDPLGTYASSTHQSFYPPGYPIQTYVDPSNPNAGKVLLPTPPVEPMCGTLTYEQMTPQTLLPDPGLPSPTQQPVIAIQHVPTPIEVSSTLQYMQQSVPQDPAVAVLSGPTPTGQQQVQGQSYALWDHSAQQPLAVQPQPYQPAQPQTAVYYQGQPCQAVYSNATPYAQTSTTVVQVRNSLC
ncbi:UNVERIFIED_CONTAM: hypothetical protein FKN15_004465 [Acipenser sinensis]